MSNALCSKQNSIIQVHVCHRAVPKSFSCVEQEGYFYVFLFLVIDESKERFRIIYKRLIGIFLPYKIKPCGIMAVNSQTNTSTRDYS